jgi:hypothetical protein
MDTRRIQVKVPEGMILELERQYGHLDLPLSKLVLLGLSEWWKQVKGL